MSSMLPRVLLCAPTHYRLQETQTIMQPSMPVLSTILMNPRLRLLYSVLALLLVLGLCAYAASVLLDWMPGAHGLPPDIAAIQPPARGF